MYIALIAVFVALFLLLGVAALMDRGGYEQPADDEPGRGADS
jgi:hypothetical protein